VNDDKRTIRTVQVLLTIVALEFFGPIIRDFSPSHALNPTWVGHARVHLVWLLGFMFFSGVANVWLIWFRRPFERRNLWLSVIWQGCNLGGFWVAYLLVDVYEGLITVPETHVDIFGYDENVFVFTVLSLILIAAVVVLRSASSKANADA
jgi:hypothetical protein